MKILDGELYYAWLATHHELDSKSAPAPAVLGGPEFIYDREDGICIAVVYRNPDLEAQAETAALWKALAKVASSF